MRNIILQHWTGELTTLVEKSIRSFQEYAKMIGCEHEFIRGDVFMTGKSHVLQPPCQKLVYLDEKYDKYDMVVMVDADMFVRKGFTGNVFTDATGIGRHTQIQTELRRNIANRHPLHCSVDHPYWGGSIFRLSLELRQKFRKALSEEDVIMFGTTYHDEGTMHRLAVKTGMKEDKDTYLDGQLWNYSSFEPDVDRAHFIHIRTKVKPHGPKRSKIENLNALISRGLI